MFNYKTLGKFIKNFILNIGVLFLFLSIFNLPAQAQVSIADLNILGVKCLFPGQTTTCTPTSPNLYDNVVNFMFLVAPLLSVLVIMWGGYRYFFGSLSGDRSDGKRAIFAGTTGLLLVLVAQLVVNIVKNLVTPTGSLNPSSLLAPFGQITNFLFIASGVIAVLVIIWGGYKYMFSALPTGQKDGKDTIQAGLIGLVLVFSAFIISNLIATIFGLKIDGTGALKNSSGASATISDTSSTSSISTTGVIAYAKVAVDFLIPVAVVLTVFFIIVGAYQYIIGRDINKGKAAIINAIIGLIVIILATTIVALVVYFIPGF